MFTSPAKREIRRFHIVVVQRRQRNVQKSVLQVQSSCFANLIQLLFCRSHCHRHLRRGCLTSVLVVVVVVVVVMMMTTTTTTDEVATTMTTTTKTVMMMMMMISYVSQEHSRAGSNCFWKLRVKVIHYSFTRKQNSISFFFRRNGETVVIAKTSGLTGMNPAFWKNWLPSSVRLRRKVPKFRDVWRRHRVEETNQSSCCGQQIV